MSLSRRLGAILVCLTAAGSLVAGCGGGTDPGASGPSVTVDASNGRVTVPVTADRVWALDEYAALDLLAVGVVPVTTVDVFHAKPALDIVRRAGGTVISSTGVEQVAAARPRLIVGLPYSGHQQVLNRLTGIAPVVLLPKESSASLAVAGQVTGRDAEARRIQQRIDAKVTDLAGRVARSPFAGRTYAVLSGTPDTTLFAYDLTPVFDRLGLKRPPNQPDLNGPSAAGYIQVSAERLGDHRADITFLLVDRYYTGGKSLLSSPLFDPRGSLVAQTYYLGWFSPTSASVWWITRDVDAILFKNGRIATEDDGPAIWSEMTGR